MTRSRTQVGPECRLSLASPAVDATCFGIYVFNSCFVAVVGNKAVCMHLLDLVRSNFRGNEKSEEQFESILKAAFSSSGQHAIGQA